MGLGEVVVIRGQAERMALTAYPNNVQPNAIVPARSVDNIVRPLTNGAGRGAESVRPHAT
jgi:hypothetical protein